MTRKEKIIYAIILLIFGTAVNIYITHIMNFVLSGNIKFANLPNFMEALVSICFDNKHRMLFIASECFLALFICIFFVQSNKTYKSDLIDITEYIKTPIKVGQNQHGSARWLEDKEKEQVFDTLNIDTSNQIIKTLIKTGYNNLNFINDKTTTRRSEKQETAQDTSSFYIDKTTNERNCENEENIKEKHDDEVIDTDDNNKYKMFSQGGIVVGKTKEGSDEKLYFVGSDTHTLTIGATRSGKSRCLVIPSICTLGLAGESMVITDPKAELFQYTSEFLKKIGYEVICLDFKNTAKSSRYNLLQPVIDAINDGDIEKAEAYAWDITNILVGDNSSNEKIWENGEKSTIAGAILCVVYDNKKKPQYQNLTNVYWFIAEMGKLVGNQTLMEKYMEKMKKDHPARALLSIAAVAPSRTKGSFDTSALTTLRLFTSKSIYSITHISDYKIAEIGEKKQALFLILPDEKTTYYPIASLMVSQLYELLVRKSDERGGRLKNRVNFILDEFGNFAALTDFSTKLTVAGGRGMRFNLFLQSFEQLTDKYSKELCAIVKSNCQTWIYLQADDDETLEAISKKLGKYTTSAYQLSGQHGRFTNPSTSHSISLVGRELLTTDEIRRIRRPDQIVVGRSYPAIMHAPDLSKWQFNKMCGLGDEEHNRLLREERETKRPIVTKQVSAIPLWGIWRTYEKIINHKN